MVTFGQRAQAALTALGPLCVGVDPTPALLAQWGLPDAVGSVAAFGDACIQAAAGVAAVVKPQVSLYERHGSRGFAVLETFIEQAHAAGLLVVADAKRGDGIASSAAGYADAWLRPDSPLCADAVTVTGYLGLGALAPMVEAARDSGNGLLVVVRSSNPEGAAVQDSVTPTGALLADAMLAEVAALNMAETRAGFLGSIGVVAGANVVAGSMDLAAVGGVILAPGFGAQGATPGDLARLFGHLPEGVVLASVSRDVLRHGPDVGRLREAMLLWQQQFRSELHTSARLPGR